MRCSIIISAYNNHISLEKTLWSLQVQQLRPQQYIEEIIVADDGSGPAVAELLASFRDAFPYPLRHLWQEDRGFRKAKILNRAIHSAFGEYLIFMDGDIIAAHNFVAQHLSLSKPKQFLSGGNHVNFPLSAQHRVALTRQVVQQQHLFSRGWLKLQQVSLLRGWRLWVQHPVLARCVDELLPRPNAFLGCNASCWKADALAVGGFNEAFEHYGYEDRDFGLRLAKAGVHGKRYQCSLRYIHLDHDHPYACDTAIAINKKMLPKKKVKH